MSWIKAISKIYRNSLPELLFWVFFQQFHLVFNEAPLQINFIGDLLVFGIQQPLLNFTRLVLNFRAQKAICILIKNKWRVKDAGRRRAWRIIVSLLPTQIVIILSQRLLNHMKLRHWKGCVISYMRLQFFAAIVMSNNAAWAWRVQVLLGQHFFQSRLVKWLFLFLIYVQVIRMETSWLLLISIKTFLSLQSFLELVFQHPMSFLVL